MEEDEAGKLRAFRAKFGRGWDAEAAAQNADAAEAEAGKEGGNGEGGKREETDHLLDLISGRNRKETKKAAGGAAASAKGKGGAKKAGKK